MRKDWMFKLVGAETFMIGKDKQHKCVISIEPLGMRTKYKKDYVTSKSCHFFSKQKTTTNFCLEKYGNFLTLKLL